MRTNMIKDSPSSPLPYNAYWMVLAWERKQFKVQDRFLLPRHVGWLIHLVGYYSIQSEPAGSASVCSLKVLQFDIICNVADTPVNKWWSKFSTTYSLVHYSRNMIKPMTPISTCTSSRRWKLIFLTCMLRVSPRTINERSCLHHKL